MKCPNCGGQLLLTAFSNDNEGESITSFYRCEYCKIEFDEEDLKNPNELDKD